MKPGTKVAFVMAGRAYLATLDQPLLVGTERRWSVTWADGLPPDGITYPEQALIPVVPQ